MLVSADVVVSKGVEQDDLVMPVIDFSAFLHGTPATRQQTAMAVLSAFKTSGFLYLTGHSVPAPMIDQAFAQSARFFSRPQSQKDSLCWTTAESNRGYVTWGREKVTQSTDAAEIAALRAANPDLKESMEIGREGVPGLPNRWPESLDEEGAQFTQDMKVFFLQLKELHVQVMSAIALGMGFDEHFFDTFTDKGDNNLRLLHYPPVEKSVFKKNPLQVRAGAHSDYGSITLLIQDDVGGLEVLSPRGTWVRAKPVQGSIVVNAGDLLARWSNDVIKSTRHRVIAPPPKEDVVGGEEPEDPMFPARYSIAYFCNPNFDRLIEALPGTWAEGETEKKYDPIKSGDYLVQRLAATY